MGWVESGKDLPAKMVELVLQVRPAVVASVAAVVGEDDSYKLMIRHQSNWKQ